MADHLQTHRKSVSKAAKNTPVRTNVKRASTRSAQKRVTARAASGAQKKPSKSAGFALDGLADKARSLIGAGNRTSKKRTAARSKAAAGSSEGALEAFKTRFFSSRIAMGAAIVVIFCLAIGLWDGAANMGKAYGNVSVGGIDVSGMNAGQIHDAIEERYGSGLADAQLTIYASEDAREREGNSLAKRESVAQAEQLSAAAADAAVTSWNVSAHSLNAAIPYDEVAEKALAAGRDDGFLGRMRLFASHVDIPLELTFDDGAIETLASNIDAASGEERIDSTVEIDGGQANATRGRDGKMVDRSWLRERISALLLGNGNEADGGTAAEGEGDGEAAADDASGGSLVAELSDAPSRTTYEQAQQAAAGINRALNADVQLTYKGDSWHPSPEDIGNWTDVEVVQADDGYELLVSLDASAATSDVAKNVQAGEISGNVVVDFEANNGSITVKTSGSGVIPEISPAVETVGERLYGQGGIAWSQSADTAVSVEVGESNAPESLTFEQAVDLGVITVIGEYTTEYSNAEGTENRNHNIRLAADLLNDSIAESNGGTWSFNGISGDTNLDPPFASAGSIVDGEYVDSIGGGICQVATTVFNAVYEAGLNVVERHNHSLYIESYPTGRDAAVSYPDLDLIWKNDQQSDILLKLDYTDNSLSAHLYSTPTGLTVTSETGEWEEGEKYKTEFEPDDSLGEGEYYLKTTGSDGSQISVVRTVRDANGQVLHEDSFASIYTPKNEVYLVGPGTDTGRLVRNTAADSEGDYQDPYAEELDDGYAEEDYLYDGEYGQGDGTYDDSYEEG